MRDLYRLLLVFMLAVMVVFSAVSCSGGSAEAESSEASTKLPPGADQEMLPDASNAGENSEITQTSDERETDELQSEEGLESGEEQDAEDETVDTGSTAAEKTAYLSGANFTVVSATREDSNEIALTSGAREVAGDYLLVELAISNVGDELVDLADFSFRLWNPAIDADLYEDYYGSDETYGGYVSENIISATLLDYESLQQVSYQLKMGEAADNVFLFFDLNPQSTAANEGVTMAGTNFIVYDTGTGDKTEINLSGYGNQ